MRISFRLTATILAFSLSFNILSAQTPKFKFGEPAGSILYQKEYAQDKEAEAVCLYEGIDLSFDVSNGVFLYYGKQIRIKILTEEGRQRFSSISIPFKYGVEEFTEFKVCSIMPSEYENIKTEVAKRSFRTEHVNGDTYARSVDIPNVEVGSVIDISYRIKSTALDAIPSIDLQHSIPVRYSNYCFSVPDYVEMKCMTRGNIPVEVKRNLHKKTIPGAAHLAEMYVLDQTCEMEYIPALRNDANSYCSKDYRCGFDYELTSVRLHTILNRTYSGSWKTVCKTLDGHKDFGRNLREKNAFDAETRAIMKAGGSDEEKIRQITQTVRNHVGWNGKYELFGSKDGLASVPENGKGNSADLNFLLYSALKGSGFKVVPVLVNPREMGRISEGRPRVDWVNAFILNVKTSDGKSVFVDAAYGDVNMLNPLLLIDNARIYDTGKDLPPVDLTGISNNQEFIQIVASASPDGVISGTVSKRYTNMCAMGRESSTETFKTETGEIRPIPVDLGIGNPFKDKSRVLPVDYPFPKTINIMSTLTLPEGVTAKNLPQPVTLSFGDNKDIQVIYNCTAGDNGNVNTQMRLTIARTTYQPEDFPVLDEIFTKITELLTATVTTK